MKKLLALILFLPATVFAQATPAALSTDPQQIESLIKSSGCQYEVTAAAQTIAALQKRINELEKKQAADPPPKSGVTKH